MTFDFAGENVEAPQGTFVLVPRDTPHAFGNRGSDPASFLELFSPAGMEGYFEEWRTLEPVRGGSAYSTLSPDALRELAAKYHMEFL